MVGGWVHGPVAPGGANSVHSAIQRQMNGIERATAHPQSSILWVASATLESNERGGSTGAPSARQALSIGPYCASQARPTCSMAAHMLTAAAGLAVAHCPQQRTSSIASPAAAFLQHRRSAQPQRPPSRVAISRGQAAAAVKAIAMAAKETKSVSGTMAELKKEGK